VESFRGSGLFGGGSGAKVMSGLETRRFEDEVHPEEMFSLLE
jgi:hypothetical protein